MYRRKLRARQMAALCAVLFAAGALQWTLQHTIQKDGSAFLPTLTSLVLYWQTGRYGQLPDAAQEETALPAVQAPDEPETDLRRKRRRTQHRRPRRRMSRHR